MYSPPKRIPTGGPGVLAYSENFELLGGGLLNIIDNLNEIDCKLILEAKSLTLIRFVRKFTVLDKTFALINNRILTAGSQPTFGCILNGFGAINDLTCLSQLTNLKSLHADMRKNNQIEHINKHLNLKSLAVDGEGISVKSIVEQKDLERLTLMGKLKDAEVIGSMSHLKEVNLWRSPLKNLDCLVSLEKLTELNIAFGSAGNYERLPDIGKIEKLSFTYVQKLTIDHLLPINGMKYLKELKFDYQPHLTDLNWLTNKAVKTEVFRCKNYKKACLN